MQLYAAQRSQSVPTSGKVRDKGSTTLLRGKQWPNVMFVARAIVTLDGFEQPGRFVLQPWSDESDAGRASSRTTVPTGEERVAGT
jgi:hypothetical protein